MSKSIKQIVAEIKNSLEENLSTIEEEMYEYEKEEPTSDREKQLFIIGELRDVLDSMEDDYESHIEPDDYEPED